MTISWDMPGERESGEKLYAYEIAGYTLAYYPDGSTREDAIEVDIADSELTAHELQLEKGIWHFAVNCYDIDGVKSSFTELNNIDLRGN